VPNPYLQYNGVFDSRTASINSQLKTITTQQADLQARLNQYQTSLMAQFTAMDSYVAQMNQSMSFLSKLN
jgi:flagellar hook-associated protein 2